MADCVILSIQLARVFISLVPMDINPKIDILERIRNTIASGQWHAGEAIPKIRFLCQSWNLSATTLICAIRQAAQEQLLHKKGKYWIIGPEPSLKSSENSNQIPPTILIASHRLNEWSEFHQNLLAGFVIGFGFEANRHKVRLYPVLTGEGEKEDRAFPCGRQAIQKFRQELGSAYLGTIFTPLAVTTKNLVSSLSFFQRLGGPVVWMQDELPAIKRSLPQQILRISYGDWGSKPGNSSAHIALASLYEKGHRRIAFLTNEWEQHNWLANRLQALEREASSFKELTIHRLLKSPRTSDDDLVRSAFDDRITALIAPNDEMAIRYYLSCNRAGKIIPHDISLVSFDNRYTLKPFPISSVDFGLEFLGYQAFHYIYGVIPIPTGRHNQLFGINQLHDSGSIAMIK